MLPLQYVEDSKLVKKHRKSYISIMGIIRLSLLFFGQFMDDCWPESVVADIYPCAMNSGFCKNNWPCEGTILFALKILLAKLPSKNTSQILYNLFDTVSLLGGSVFLKITKTIMRKEMYLIFIFLEHFHSTNSIVSIAY